MSNQYIKAYVKRGEVITDITEERVLNDTGVFEDGHSLEQTINNFDYDLFKKASLIVTPNGYKENKLYAVKPIDGSGDMTVSRGSTATRVNEDGLIEQAPYNLLTYSETFDNAIWVKNGSVTVTTNATTSPNGSLTADLITNVNNTDFISQIHQTNVVGVEYTYSVYVKNNNSVQGGILVRNTVNAVFGTINWTGPILSSITGIANGTITYEYVRDGWYRIIATFTSVESIIRPRFTPDTSIGNKSVYLWGAQLVEGSEPKPYFQTTDRLDVPTINWDNGKASLLVEPQRTNLAKYSDDFSNATWAKTRATITSNATTAPDGTLTADKLILSVDNNTHFIQQPGITVTAQIYSATVYAKKAEYDTVRILLANYWSPTPSVIFNLTTKSIVSTASATAKITELKDGWFKLYITATINAIAGGNAYFSIYGGNNGTISLAGDGTSGLYLWGAQLEAGSNATSYIPTSASITTRGQYLSYIDLLGKSFWNKNNFTISWEGTFIYGTTANLTFGFSDLTNTVSTATLVFYNNGTLLSRNADGSSPGGLTIGPQLADGSKFKCMIKRTGTEIKVFRNGTLLGSTTREIYDYRYLNISNGGSIYTLDLMYMIPESLSDSECIKLTTL